MSLKTPGRNGALCTAVGLALLFLLLLCNPLSGGELTKLLRFEENDSLDVLREKIEKNGYSFTVDRNWVFDMSPEEKASFFSRRIGPFPPRISDGIGPLADHLDVRRQPSSFDWRSYNGHSYIGPIRDQSTCGACYAFAACAAAEGTYNWATGLFDGNCSDFSEAFVAFCLSDLYSGFDGCDGANYDYEELDALVDHGVCNESVYPYTPVEQPCNQSSWNAPRVQFQAWYRIPCNDVDAIKTAIMTYGAVDAAVWVESAFQGYSGGVYEDTNTTCSGSPCYYTSTNHAIALVGWDDTPPEGGGGVWILRNSWGASWGEAGYMRIRYTSAFVACESCYMVYTPEPTPTPAVKPYLSAFKHNSSSLSLNVYRKPEMGDWNYWDAAARNPSPLVTDGAAIPGGVVIACTDVDIDGDGRDELAVLKRDYGWDMNLYLYEGLRPPAQRNKFPIARDFWIIPAGENILAMANPGDVNGDGREDLAVLKREGGNDYNLYIYNSPVRGDTTYDDAWSRNMVPMAWDLWLIPGGNDIMAMTGVDLDGDFRNDGLAVVRNQSGDRNLYVWKSPAAGEWSYGQALARQDGFGGPGTPQARDFWVIPGGNEIVNVAPAQYSNSPEGKLAVLRNRGGDQNIYIYNLPRLPDRTYWDAIARNPSPLARDFWMIPSGNGIVDALSTN